MFCAMLALTDAAAASQLLLTILDLQGQRNYYEIEKIVTSSCMLMVPHHPLTKGSRGMLRGKLITPAELAQKWVYLRKLCS